MSDSYKTERSYNKLVDTPLRIVVVVLVLILQFLLLIRLFPIFESRVFALTLMSSITGGILFGKKIGAAVGLLASFDTFLAQYYLGFPIGTVLNHGAFGITINLLIGVGFGVLHDSAGTSRKAIQDRIKAEEKQERLEQHLLQSQKLEAIGTLAGGVAHDMNNILGIIMSSASMLQTITQPGTSEREDVENILSACRRGRDLTRNLLGFARKGTYVKDIVDLNDIVAQSIKLLTPIINKNINIKCNLDDSLYQIYGDKSQIEQALMNICINAAEAIESAGTISITTKNCGDKDSALLEEAGLYSGDYAMIEIKDTGCGIDPEIITHVFEPFFTTRQPGKGTGLGLSMAYGTIKNHGGGLLLRSTVGEGTALILLIPAVVSEQRIKVQRRISVLPSAPTGRSILLVDDEPLVLSSNRRLLQSLGYDVILADSGEKAIQVYRDSAKRISIIILDFVMPGMDGEETFKHIRELNPNAKVVISSGYSRDGRIETMLEQGAMGFLQKPFDTEQLSDLLTSLPKTGTFQAVKIS